MIAGLLFEECEKIMQQYSKSRQELNKVLEISKLVQKAKFQARLKYIRENFYTTNQQNQSLHQLKTEMGKKYLKYAVSRLLYCRVNDPFLSLIRKITETIGKISYDDAGILEEYHRDIAKLEKR